MMDISAIGPEVLNIHCQKICADENQVHVTL